MSDSATFPPAFEPFVAASDFTKPTDSLDFFSYQASDILAPHPDIFETELDSSLAGFDFQLLTVDSNDAYSYLRSDTPTCGPPSTITVSSESAYDSLSSHSESFYNYPHSPYPASNYSFPLDLEMDFQRIRVDSVQEYGTSQPAPALDTVDPTSFGALPPTPPRSPPTQRNGKGYDVPAHRGSFSDYGSPRRTSEYYGLNYNSQANGQTVAPTNTNTQLPVVPSVPLVQSGDDYKGDPRKKYKCAACPRAFARAYNLKTHMATHDPNRLKPHVCPHRPCGRSFSRKHDLGRHLISIHRDDSVCSSHHSATSKKSIGVEQGNRSWCDSCGKGWVGKTSQCSCNDVK